MNLRVSENTVYQYVENMNNFAIYRQPEAKFHILQQFDLQNYHTITPINETPEMGYIKLNNNLEINQAQWSGDYFERYSNNIESHCLPGL